LISSEIAQPASRKLVAERRVVTILFADVAGSTALAENLDPEDWAEMMNEAFTYFTQPVIRYGGTVARLMGDAMLAFFGAPTAHEDDPLRAVLAGLEIQKGVQAFRKRISVEFNLDFDVRVGINTGIAVVGEVGTPQAGEYTAMGDAVNLASRMEQTAAPGTIQITEETYRLVAPWIEAESIGEIEIKGKHALIPVYRVVARKEIPSRARGIAGINSALVGRTREIKTIQSMFRELSNGQGQILTLVGEAGLGKSRLIDEMHAVFEQDQVGRYQWFESRGISYEMNRPYGLFVEPLRQACQIQDDDSLEVLRRKVRKTLTSLPDDQQTRILNTYEILVAADQDIEAESSPIRGEVLKREIYASMLDLWTFKAMGKPLILVLDDLQWADPASVELIGHLFELVEQVPIFFVCALRPHQDAPAWSLRDSAASNASRAVEIILPPLTENDSNQLVDNILQIAELPDDLRKAILEKSEGNPFFIEEIVSTLIEKGVIQQEEDGFYWKLVDNYREFNIPDNLHALLLARIDRLDFESRRTLQMASVVGRSFNIAVLAEISPDIPDLESQLENLLRMGLIQIGTQSPEMEYSFRHELTREAAYQSILKRQRREYHRQVGEAIEKLYAANLFEVAYRLAYHFYAARDHQAALKYYQVAGKQSLQLFANREASQYFKQAIELALKLNVTSIRLAELYLSRGRALELINDFDGALDNYEELESLGRTRPDRSLELAALLPQTTIYSMPNVKFNPQLGAQLARRAMNLAIDLKDFEGEAKSLWSLLLIQTFSDDDLELAVRYGEQGLRIAREHDLEEVRAYIEHDLARPYMRLGRLDDAWDAYESSQAYWRKVGNFPMLADNLASLSESYYNAGEFDKSLQYAAEGMRISEKIDNVWGQAYNNFVIGPILVERGKIDESVEALGNTLRLSKEANFAAGIVATQMIQSWLYAMLGDQERARLYEPLIRDFVKQYESFKPLYYVNRAQNEFYAGDFEKALKTFDQLGSAYTTISELIFHPYIYTLHVELHLANDNIEIALEMVEGYINLLHHQQVKILVPDMLNQKARALIRLGRPERAFDALLEAKALAEKQESRRILWAVLADLAELEQDADSRTQLYQEAGEVVAYISAHISDEVLKERFLSLPQVQLIQAEN